MNYSKAFGLRVVKHISRVRQGHEFGSYQTTEL